MNRACFYNHPHAPRGTRPFSRGGKCLAFVSHTFTDNGPEAAAVIEDDSSGILVVVPIKDVTFRVPGNEDKR